MLVAQLDYIYFSSGLVLFLLGSVCVSISRAGPLPTPWWLLGGFAFGLGASEWLELWAIARGDSEGFHLARALLAGGSYALLLEFARRTTGLLRRETPGPWLYWPSAAVILGIALTVGPRSLEPALRLFVAAPATFWAAWLFFVAAARTRELGGSDASMRARIWAGTFFALFGIAAGLVVPPAPFLPDAWPSPESVLARTGVPMALVRAVLVGGMSLSIWALAASFDSKGRVLRKRRILFWVMASAIVALLAGGWVFTDVLGRIHERDATEDAEASASRVQDHLVLEMQGAEGAARTLAALLARESVAVQQRDVATLDALVDAVALGQLSVVVYVLDTDGTAIASSNRGSTFDLLGRKLDARPYFRSAIQGSPGRFTGFGVVTGTPGYYAAEPVAGPGGRIVAVAVVKQDFLQPQIDPGASRQVTVVASDGQIVATTKFEATRGRMWPASAGQGRPAAAAHESGSAAPPVDHELHGTEWVLVDGKKHVAVRREIPGSTWSLVVLHPERSRGVNRLLGILITLLLGAVVLGYFVAMQRQLGAESRIALKRREAEGRARELARRADTDALTGVLNRQGFNEAMTREISRSRRHAQPLAVVMVDVDHFKRVNDEFGHAVGDQVLVRIASLLQSCVRESDLVARWGGEEFVVIAPMTPETGGASLAEKLRSIMESTHLGPRNAVTASFGVAELASNDTLESLLERADVALYRAKESGRNRVCVAAPGPGGPAPATGEPGAPRSRGDRGT